MGTRSRALVLGGGGYTGIAWETGLIFGLTELGIPLGDAELMVGTSAGSAVSAQLRIGTPIEELFDAERRGPSVKLDAAFGARYLTAVYGSHLMPGPDHSIARRIGKAALRAVTMTEEERRSAFAAHASITDWPQEPLLIPAFDAVSGQRRVFDRTSGVHLIDAVAASCAVPTVLPPMTIAGERYIDGGALSSINADLAAGHDAVLVLAPTTFALKRKWKAEAQVAALGGGVRSVVVSPDREARQALGRNSLDANRTAASAEAGRRQARTIADAVARLWA